MAVLEISTAIGCPMACSYCPQDKIGEAYHGPRLMDVVTFQQAMNNSPSDIQVSFAGYAEPYLNRDTTRMIAIAMSRLHKTHVFTTGVGMTDADVDFLLKMKPHNVTLRLPDDIGDMKCKVTEEYVKRMMRLRTLECFKSVCYGHVHPLILMYGGPHWNLQNYDLHSRAGNVVHLATVGNKCGSLTCHPAPDLQNNVMIPTGELVLCCQDYGLRHIIGNLTKQRWVDIHSGPVMDDMRLRMKEGRDCLCTTCEFADQTFH